MGDFKDMEERLDNWGATVRSSGFNAEVCAEWARLFIAKRDGIAYPEGISPVERDGWLVEAAWASLPNHIAKWVLKYTYVWRMSPEQVQTRMRKMHKANLRGRKFELILAEARSALSKVLFSVSAQDVISLAKERLCGITCVIHDSPLQLKFGITCGKGEMCSPANFEK